MNYFVKLSERHSIYPSKHTGEMGLWETNSVYGYDAALDYASAITPEVLARWAKRIGLPYNVVRDAYVEVVRKGNAAMRPRPDFTI